MLFGIYVIVTRKGSDKTKKPSNYHSWTVYSKQIIIKNFNNKLFSLNKTNYLSQAVGLERSFLCVIM